MAFDPFLEGASECDRFGGVRLIMISAHHRRTGDGSVGKWSGLCNLVDKSLAWRELEVVLRMAQGS